MLGEIQLLRPLNCFMSVIAVAISIIIVTPLNEIASYSISIIFALISAFLITGAGNALNDYADQGIDKIAHYDRPLPSGKVRPVDALRISAGIILISLILAYLINILCFFVALIAIFIEIGYATYFHKRALGKNIPISALVGLLFVYGGVAVNQPWAIELWILAALAFIINMAREVIKDVEDIDADQKSKRNTLPIISGIKTANIYTFSFLTLGVALSPLPYLLGSLSQAYLPIVAIADAVFLYSIIEIPLPNFAKTSIKIGMLLALGAFIAGAFL